MALANYSNLQSAISTELNISTGGLATAVIQDAITRAEAKINRRTRLREAEQLSYATLTSSSAFLAVPTGMVELLNLRIRLASAADTAYEEVKYVAPERLHEYYGGANDSEQWHYTLRDQLEFDRAPSSNHRVMMHYLKAWDIASDSTNWLLTNYPDAYLYGSLAECEMHVRNDERVPLWKTYFDDAIRELNSLDDRGRDDAELSTLEVAKMGCRSAFNILTD